MVEFLLTKIPGIYQKNTARLPLLSSVYNKMNEVVENHLFRMAN